MFTGIVEEVGRVRTLQHRAGGAVLAVECAAVLADASPGDSISVNGCCVTVTEVVGAGAGCASGFRAELMGETLERTGLGALAPGARVNLERAVRADGRLGGHLVQGHVDGTGAVLAVEPRESWTLLRCALPAALAPYVAEKGSIAVDGTSLTVTAVEDDAFEVGLIPHTLAATALSDRRAGDTVNLEVDVVAKYVERLLRDRQE